MLAIFGIFNIWLAQRIRKSSRPIWTFYLFSGIVVILRILLFMDPFVHWRYETYALLLVSMPSYLYLLVGLSQVMLNFESIIKYKNFKIREEETLTKTALKAKINKNKKYVDISYLVLYFLLFALGSTFVSLWAVYSFNKK